MNNLLSVFAQANEMEDIVIYQDTEKDGSNTEEDLNGFQSERLSGVYETEEDLAEALENGEAC